MKNRDHTNISARGAANLEAARRERMKPVILVKDDSPSQLFESYAACARFLADYYDGNSESFRYRLKNHRSHIKDYDVIYLNAETIHDGSTEQEIVHESDLTGDYTTAFNEGKQQEVEMRIKHFHTPRDREVAHDHSVKDKKAT